MSTFDRIQKTYVDLWDVHSGEPFTHADVSLDPRPPTFLYEYVDRLGIAAGSIALDVGCGRDNHSCLLAQRYGCRVWGVDLVPANVRRSQTKVESEGVASSVSLTLGSLESLPFTDESFDLVWSRDMLVHVPDVEQAMREAARVLRPGAAAIIYTTLETDRMTPGETERAFDAMGISPSSMRREAVERAMDSAGLTLEQRDETGGEQHEYFEETERRSSGGLLRVSRLLRSPELFEEMDRDQLEMAVALHTWDAYHLLGKLSTTIYVLRKTE